MRVKAPNPPPTFLSVSSDNLLGSGISDSFMGSLLRGVVTLGQSPLPVSSGTLYSHHLDLSDAW